MIPPGLLAVFRPDGTNLDRAPLCRRDAAGDLNRLVAILGFDEEVAAELFLGLGEWAVRRGELAVADANGGGLIGVLEAVRSHVIASLFQSFGEPPVVLLGNYVGSHGLQHTDQAT